MKLSNRFFAVLFVLSLFTYVSARNIGDTTSLSDKEASSKGNLEEVSNSASISLSWCGTGPYGQVDASVSGGSAPYEWYRSGSLIQTSYSSSVTLNFGCNGGALTVKDSNGNQDTNLIPQGCVNHGCY